MPAAQLAVLVLARTLCDTDTGAAVTVTAIEVGAERATRAIGVFHAGWELRTEGVAPAMTRPLLLRAIEAQAVRVRIVLTVHETDTTVSTATGTRFSSSCQGGPRNCGSQGRARYGTGDAARRCTAADLLISHSFGYVFEPISHRHLLVLT